MWIGAYEQEGRTCFFAITSDKNALGPFFNFDEAQLALKAHEERLGNDKSALVELLKPILVHRQVRIGKNTYGKWLIADAVAGMLIFFFSDELLGEGYLVVIEDAFILVDTFPSMTAATKAAMIAANKYRR